MESSRLMINLHNIEKPVQHSVHLDDEGGRGFFAHETLMDKFLSLKLITFTIGVIIPEARGHTKLKIKFKLVHLAYVLRWNRGKNIYFFSHI